MTSPELSLLLVSEAQEWSRYITCQLAKSPQVHHQSIVMDTLLYENPPEVFLACQQSAVVMLLVTPDLIEFMKQKAGWFSRTLQEVPSTSAVVLFLLLDEKDSQRVRHIAQESYASADWTFFDPGYEVRDVYQTIARVLDIVEKCQAARRKVSVKGEDAADSRPDKVGEKEEQSAETKCETVQKEEEVSGAAEQAEAVTAVKKRPPSPPSKNPQQMVQFFPSVLYESGEQVAMVFKEEVRGNLTLKVEHTDIHLTPDRENEKVFTFLAPELAPGKHKVLILEDGKRRTRSSLTVRGAEWGMFQSPRYLCQTLGVVDLHHLDLRLKEVFNTSTPAPGSGLDILFHHLAYHTEQQTKHSDSLYPTLLHYAAAYGLSEFCAAVLECPGSSQAYQIHNCEGHDPADLAAKGGFGELENYIIDFMDMHAANEIYDSYVTMNRFETTDCDAAEDYEDMSQMTPPTPRRRAESEPSVSVSVSVTQPPALPPPRGGVVGAGRADRPFLPAPRPKDGVSSTRSMSERRASPPFPLQAISEVQVDHKSATLAASTAHMGSADFMGMGHTDKFQPQLAEGSLGSRSQSELIELHDMVKSKEITLNEARMLFNSWQHRYGKKPSSSFKDRQKELTDIKTEYQKVRETLKEQDKSKSFFARLGLGGRPAKPTIKVNISDPLLQRQQKKGPKVYTKSASTSQLFGDRASSASTLSSSSSSRDSGWSQGSRDSHVSSNYEGDSEDYT